MSCQTKPHQLPNQPLCHYEFMFNLCLFYHLLSGKWHSSSARFVNVSTVRKFWHSPVKGADPKEALLQVKNESRNLHCWVLTTARSFLLPIRDCWHTAHHILPLSDQQIPNSTHVSRVMPKHLFFLRKEPYSDSNHILTPVSGTLFLDPLDWHPNHSLKI